MEISRLTTSEQQVQDVAAPSLPTPPRLDLEDLYCILQIEPYDSLIAFELARRLEKLNRKSEALRVLRKVVEIDSRFETVFALANLEYDLDHIDEALEHFQTALLLAPDQASILFAIFKSLGNVFVKKGDFHSAEDSYNKAFRLNAQSDVLQVNLATLAIQKNDWDEALLRFREALRLNMQNDKAWVGLGLGHRFKGDLELAWGNVEAALSINPLNEVALTLVLEWCVPDAREARAHELLRTFLVNGGWNEKFSMAFCRLSLRRGEKHVARTELERLLLVDPQHSAALQLLGELRTMP